MSKTKKYIQEKTDRLTKGYLQRGEKGNLILKPTEHRALLCDQKFLTPSRRSPKIVIRTSILIKPIILLELKTEFRKVARFRANHAQ